MRNKVEPSILPEAICNPDRIAAANATKDEWQRELVLVGPFDIFFPPELVNCLKAFRRRLSPYNYGARVKSAVRRNDRPVSLDLREDRHVLILEHRDACQGLFVNAVSVRVNKHRPIAIGEFVAHILDESRGFDLEAGVDPD